MERKLYIPVDEAFKKPATLDPDTYRREEPEVPLGTINVRQVDRPMSVRNLTEMHVPCACGRPLLGLETDWIVDGSGFALYVRGVCLTCGRQDAMYLGNPARGIQETQEQREARLREDVTRVLAGIAALPSLDQPGVEGDEEAA